ncbi:hypothetical protein DS745_23020 [Anaerobacillus alkaliphilus]|uniref:Uncharacterized protein n=1 Tax=Anaerobacillus alkaliphilus TaxID=1548597 RepID=A0A4Q0VMP3_9BACI|nr:hypothetical protein [Anaerobacillus alkaliphilus]RXI96578.1 hypothetical protein DS745_23020 [Anaerobacillus alkaliphilus]
MRKIFSILAFVFIVTACSPGVNLDKMNENTVINKMKAEGENQYHLYTFWIEFPSTYREDTDMTDELGEKSEIHSNTFDYSMVNTEVIRLISFQKKEHAKEYIKALNIDEFPTFIVLDNKGIILRTTNVNEINEFLGEHQMDGL